MNVNQSAFYVTGGTLHPDAACYVERQADQQLLAALERGEFCYVLTPRQMGKSSLMVRVAARLRRQGIGAVLLDLTAIGRNLTPGQWYQGLLAQLGQRLDLEDELEAFWNAHEHLGPLQRWMAAVEGVVLPGIRDARSEMRDEPEPATPPDPSHISHPASRIPHPASRLVLFIDEIDTVRSLPFSTDEFFAAIRHCYTRRAEDPALERLTFCLLGVATPSDLIRDPLTTPFNIGTRIELTDFTLEEALPLAEGLVGVGNAEWGMRNGEPNERGVRDAESGVRSGESPGPCPLSLAPPPAAQRLLRRVLYWTGGHPYLTQRLCQAILDWGLRNSD